MASNQSESAPPTEGTEHPGAAAPTTSKNAEKKKRKKAAKKAAAASASEGASSATPAATEASKPVSPQEVLITKEKEKSDKYLFWNSQPVPKIDEVIPEGTNEHIEPPKEKVLQDPYPLPSAFEWDNIDVDDDKAMKEVYVLLNENYVEDDDNMFRFDYSIPFLKWALKPPGWRRDWHLGVRVKTNRKLVGFITAIPATISVYDKPLKMVEINFLCVHKKLRDKRLAPVLIMEITRRVNLTNIWQAVYTAGVVLPKPVARCRYWHRSLNPKKLIDVGFSHLSARMTMSRTIKLYKLPKTPQIPGLRSLAPGDIPAAYKLVSNYLRDYKLAPVLDEQEFAHWFLTRDGVVNSYVVEDLNTREITDFISFYTLPSTIIGNATYSTLKAAYSYYNVSTVRTEERLKQLINDALILAKNLDFDVYNCLDVFENATFFKDLKFGPGDGYLQYYLYNWRCPEIPPSKVGLVLL